jgi:hypothetical protein
MIALAADENFNNRIVRGLIRRNRQLDVVRVQDVGLSGAPDPDVLAWAADARRVLVTHDVSTMWLYAQQRVDAKLPMSGVIACSREVPIRLAIDDLQLLAECSIAGEWDDQLLFLPL